MNGATLEAAMAAKQTLAPKLAALPELRGIGVAVLDCGFGVKVNLSRPVAAGVVPDDVDGVPVIVDVVGEIRPL